MIPSFCRGNQMELTADFYFPIKSSTMNQCLTLHQYGLVEKLSQQFKSELLQIKRQ